MNYIWEVLLKAQKDGMDQKMVCFKNAEVPSPYLEIAMDDLNSQDLSAGIVEVNPFYRFGHVFECMLDGSLESMPELRDALFDIIIHLLAKVSLLEGMSKTEYYNRYLRRDMANGYFGQQGKDILSLFSLEQQRHVAEHMVRLYTVGPSVFLLRSLLQTLYPVSMIYLDITEQRELLIYIGKKRTPELEKQVSFLFGLFVPLDLIQHLFWDMHFGIIGVDETMEMDQIMIY